jgi:hypothetical protein
MIIRGPQIGGDDGGRCALLREILDRGLRANLDLEAA